MLQSCRTILTKSPTTTEYLVSLVIINMRDMLFNVSAA